MRNTSLDDLIKALQGVASSTASPAPNAFGQSGLASKSAQGLGSAFGVGWPKQQPTGLGQAYANFPPASAFESTGIARRNALAFGNPFSTPNKARPAPRLNPFGQRARKAWTELEKRAVWEKGSLPFGLDPQIWRFDHTNNLIRWDEYGNSASEYGWEIDHIVPRCWDGDDHISNLRPLKCSVNRSVGGMLGSARRG